MPSCFFEAISSRKVRCVRCGTVVSAGKWQPHQIRRRCSVADELDGDDRVMPSTLARTARYAKDVTTWIAAGMPTRTPDEVDHILATFCHKCKFYNPELSACSPCGCAVNRKPQPLANALAMKTKKCPKNYWE